MILAAGTLAAGLLLSGCTAIFMPSPTESEPAPVETVEPAEPVPTVLLISLDGVSVLNDDESVADEATFDDGQAVLELLGDVAGSTPEGQVNGDGYPITFYDWGQLGLAVVNDAGATLSVNDDEFGGLAVHTTDGVHIGSTGADAAAAADYQGSDFNGDGQPDYFGLETVVNPDYQSLERPGEPGVDFVAVVVEGGVVTHISSPSNNYNDL
jgi:hypothetical protein